MKTVVLIGPPDCGKSTLGELVAQKLGMPFIDSDNEVGKKFRERYPSGSFFDMLHSFRSIEHEVLGEIAQKENPIILSTGAETALSPLGASLLRYIGHVILVRRNKETVKEEIIKSKKPRWISVKENGEIDEKSGGFFTDMYFKEMSQYESVADTVLENDSSTEDGLSSLIEIINTLPER